MLKGISQKKLGLRQQTIDRYCEPEEDQEGLKEPERLVIGMRIMNKIEKDREMTGGTTITRTGIYKETTEKMIKTENHIIIRMGTHNETTERTIKIENSITTSKSNKEIYQNGKVGKKINREKEGKDIANNNNNNT